MRCDGAHSALVALPGRADRRRQVSKAGAVFLGGGCARRSRLACVRRRVGSASPMPPRRPHSSGVYLHWHPLGLQAQRQRASTAVTAREHAGRAGGLLAAGCSAEQKRASSHSLRSARGQCTPYMLPCSRPFATETSRGQQTAFGLLLPLRCVCHTSLRTPA